MIDLQRPFAILTIISAIIFVILLLSHLLITGYIIPFFFVLTIVLYISTALIEIL